MFLGVTEAIPRERPRSTSVFRLATAILIVLALPLAGFATCCCAFGACECGEPGSPTAGEAGSPGGGCCVCAGEIHEGGPALERAPTCGCDSASGPAILLLSERDEDAGSAPAHGAAPAALNEAVALASRAASPRRPPAVWPGSAPVSIPLRF